jgi:hypothetical protein
MISKSWIWWVAGTVSATVAAVCFHFSGATSVEEINAWAVADKEYLEKNPVKEDDTIENAL